MDGIVEVLKSLMKTVKVLKYLTNLNIPPPPRRCLQTITGFLTIFMNVRLFDSDLQMQFHGSEKAGSSLTSGHWRN